MNEAILSLFVGVIVGVIFGALDLPIPAPPVLSGVMGIVGIFGGYRLIEYTLEHREAIVAALSSLV